MGDSSSCARRPVAGATDPVVVPRYCTADRTKADEADSHEWKHPQRLAGSQRSRHLPQTQTVPPHAWKRGTTSSPEEGRRQRLPGKTSCHHRRSATTPSAPAVVIMLDVVVRCGLKGSPELMRRQTEHLIPLPRPTGSGAVRPVPIGRELVRHPAIGWRLDGTRSYRMGSECDDSPAG